MAYGSEKAFKFAKTKRITSLPVTNANKMIRLTEHFGFVHDLKNKISQHIHTQLFKLLSVETKKQVIAQAKQFNCPDELKAWEVQSIFKSTVDFYENTIVQLFRNNKFFIEKEFKVTRYKRSQKNKNGEFIFKKGDIKSVELQLKHTPLTNLINWLIYIDPEQLDTILKRIPSGKKNTQKQINDAHKFNQRLNQLRQSEQWVRVKQLILSRQRRLLGYMKVIEYTTGSYAKIAKDKNYLYSRVVIDDTNTEFKYWYIFKLGLKEEIKIPLAYSKNFHGDLSQFDLESSHYVKLNNKGRINIGMLTTTECPYAFLDGSIIPEQLAAIDLNVATNFMSIVTASGDTQIDYDRNKIGQVIQYILAQNEKGYNELSLLEDKKLKKLFGGIEFYFRQLISETLNHLKEQGITDIAMEDLDLSKTTSSYIKNKEFNIKYTRIVRMLRLSNIKHWVVQQANNLGIRVHLTNPAYTSQTCSRCFHLDKKNRNGHSFECTDEQCNHKQDADSNAARTIRQRFLKDVLLDQLHELKDGQYRPRKRSHEQIRRAVLAFKKKVAIERQAFNALETPSKSAA